LTEAIKGMTKAQFMKYSDEDFLKDMAAPITPARKKCALLALQTARQALGVDKPKKK